MMGLACLSTRPVETRPGGTGVRARCLVALLFLVLQPLEAVRAQAPPSSSTLRYGTGYFDVPVALVLPNLAFRTTYSVFWVDVDRDPEVDASGGVSAPGDARSGHHGDAAFAVGLWDRIEVGTSLQSFSGPSGGGTLAGVFGKVLLVRPERSGFGLAAGARYLGAPDFGDGAERAPSRLGFGDSRLLAQFDGGPRVDTRWTVYGVASAHFPGVTFPWLPENQVGLTAGYGTGMFAEGGELDWYAPGGNRGWFFGGSWEVQLGATAVTSVQLEHNGFDLNAGVEVSWSGARVGVFGLGLNHGDASSVYLSRKLGFVLSLTACPLLDRACRPGLRVGAPSDTVRLPAPPPDTVVIREGAGPLPAGRPLQLCLSTGEDLWVRVTPEGETRVPPRWRTLRSLAEEGWLGRYAGWPEGAPADTSLVLAGGRYRSQGPPVSPQCADLVRWAEHEGIPLFRPREDGDPPRILFLPVEPGVWQRFRRVGGSGGSGASTGGPSPGPD